MIVVPVAFIRRRAGTARRRVAVALRWAAATIRWELPAGILVLLAIFQLADDAVEVVGDLLVHLGHAGVAAALGVVDQRQGAGVLFPEFGQELGPGDEDRAGQAGIGVWAGLLNGQPAEAVGEGLGGDAVAGLGPLGLAERPVGVEGVSLAVDVDLGRLFPVPPHRLIGDLGVVRGHPM
ncbi:hypothetical protein [Streptomyces sp. FxanaA7]|uniref:hypothetical protein n=1 Tax=Streptomyces sp. FxanaA7 TaxID=1265492 RepID=UPI0018FEE18C|nr:hypothetical protein [Streptomyces sp. FxanaA7]